MDAQCDKLATVVGGTRSTTLATVDVPWWNFYKSRVWDKVTEMKVLSFLKLHNFLFDTMCDKQQVTNSSLILSAILIKHWLVTDRQTDRQTCSAVRRTH